MITILNRTRLLPRELALFAAGVLALGTAYSMVDSVLNNFLNERFTLTGFQRSFLEFPRELPGFLVVFVSALVWFLCSRRLSGWAMLAGAAGAFLIGHASPTYGLVVAWLFLYSLGQHIFLPLQSVIGMELAREGQAGRRLGQVNAIRNLAIILGSSLVFIGFRYLHFSFETTFTLASLALAGAAALFFAMKPEATTPAKTYLRLHREYRVYYLLTVLSGSRKQLFLTFAPWVLVTVFKQPTQLIATLLMIGGVIGILFQPFLGRSIDRFGERPVLAAEGILLVFVCFGYGFSRALLPERAAFFVVCACYLVDQMIFAVNMARSTYMKKIALRPGDVQPALTAGVTIDHVFSIAAALLGGAIWNAFGYEYVFLFGMFIALANLGGALLARVPGGPQLAVEPAG